MQTPDTEQDRQSTDTSTSPPMADTLADEDLPKRLLTVKSAARSAGVSERSVRRWVATGKLSAEEWRGLTAIDKSEFTRFMGSRPKPRTRGRGHGRRSSASVHVSELEQRVSTAEEHVQELQSSLADAGRRERELMDRLAQSQGQIDTILKALPAGPEKSKTDEELTKTKRALAAQRKAAEELQAALKAERSKGFWAKLFGR